MEVFLEWLTKTGSIITQLTIIGGALMWVYNKLIGAPREKRRIEEADRRARERDEYLAQMLNPLTESLKRVDNDIVSSVEDRKKLNESVGKHEERLDDHEKRIIRVETQLDSTGKIKTNYREYYGGNLHETE